MDYLILFRITIILFIFYFIKICITKSNKVKNEMNNYNIHKFTMFK